MSKKRHKTPPTATLRAPSEARLAVPDWPVLALAGIGILLTGYLSFVALTATTPVLCSSGASCDLIQQSHWSRLFGIPVAVLGLLIYLVIGALALLPSKRLRRWRRLFTVNVLALGFSLYLTLTGLLQLEAVCGWCLASLATLLALLGVLLWRRPPTAPGTPWLNWSMSHAALLLCLIGVSHAYYAGLFSARPEPQLQALAQHLKDSGAQFYGASWCPTCNQQKALFGGAAKDLPYVECSPSGRGGPFALACLNAGIENFPTWIINGRRYPELISVEDLGKRSAFRWVDPARTPASATP